jgi:hypothetical protein
MASRRHLQYRLIRYGIGPAITSNGWNLFTRHVKTIAVPDHGAVALSRYCQIGFEPIPRHRLPRFH